MPPDYSIVVPAYNEEAVLGATLETLREAMEACPWTGELVVVDNNSTDATAEIAEAAGARVVFEPVNQISRARNAGARAAEGKWLVFVDADTFVAPALLRQAIENLAGGKCCGGGACVRLDPCPDRLAEWFLNWWNGMAQRRGVAAGCFVYCLRRGYDAVKGFSERVYAGEEIWFSRALRQWGQRRGKPFRVIADPPALTSPRKMQWFTTLQMLAQTALILFFPFATLSRNLCPVWYRRPGKGE